MKLESAYPRPRVLISGGAGGEGLACARALSSCDLEMIICDIDSEGLSAAADHLGAFTRFCDATAEHSVSIFAAEIAAKFNSVNVVINAASRGYARTLAMMRMTRAVMPLLRRATGHRLVINLTPTGNAPGSGLFPYASSMASFERLTEMIAEQTRGSGIDVINVKGQVLRGVPHGHDSSDDPGAAASHEEIGRRVLRLIESRQIFERADDLPKGQKFPAPTSRLAD